MVAPDMTRARASAATYLSETPSNPRRALMSTCAGPFIPRDAELSGEHARTCREGVAICRQGLPVYPAYWGYPVYKVSISRRTVSFLPEAESTRLAETSA